MTKKEQAEVRKLIGKIADVCMRINLETDQCAFCWMSGHVSEISVSVSASKMSYNNYIMHWDAYYGEMSWNSPKGIIANLADRLAALENFLAEELAK